MRKNMAGRPKKIIKGGVSNEEKGRILYLLNTFKDSEETYIKISEDLGRPVATIKKAINEMKQALGVDTESKTKSLIKPNVIKRVLLSLITGGLSKSTAQAKINIVLSKLTEDEQKLIDEERLHLLCLRTITGMDSYITNSAGGLHDGVTIATQAASEVGDEAQKNHIPANPNIYKIFHDQV